MTHLQEQVEELQVLESVYSSPGEFEIDDESSHEQALAYLQQLALHPPNALSCRLHIPINAHQDSDDDDDDDGEDYGSGCVGAVAAVCPVQTHINVSVRLPSR